MKMFDHGAADGHQYHNTLIYTFLGLFELNLMVLKPFRESEKADVNTGVKSNLPFSGSFSVFSRNQRRAVPRGEKYRKSTYQFR